MLDKSFFSGSGARQGEKGKDLKEAKEGEEGEQEGTQKVHTPTLNILSCLLLGFS